MSTWIFQANAERFDIEGFISVAAAPFTWKVTRYGSDIAVGDKVYLWVAGDAAGVVAEARVITTVADIESDPVSKDFWRDPADQTGTAGRVYLQLVRAAASKQVLKRDWFKEDPLLKDMLIMRQPAGTNFPLTEDEAQRLALMWSRVGVDWTWDECLAGLWAYAHTLGGEVSKKAGSPVSRVSELTGRAVSGVYNKLMNFRALDPRDERAGMSGGAANDRAVWSTFYDADLEKLDNAAIDAEFERLWGAAPLMKAPDKAAVDDAIDCEVDRLSDRSLEELLDAYHKSRGAAPVNRTRSGSRVARTIVFARDALVIAIARKRAGNKCEVPGCERETFIDANGVPYTEVHHVWPLAENGPDTIDNVACLCPSHHREAHLGKAAKDLRKALQSVRQG